METIIDSFITSTAHLKADDALPIDLFQNLSLEAYGVGSGFGPLSSSAQVLGVDNIIEVVCYDPGVVKVVGETVGNSKELERVVGSLNPSVDEGTGTVKVVIPKMNRDRREGIAKLVKESGERATNQMRGVRREVMEGVKKAVKNGEGVGKDEGKRREKEVDKLCREYMARIEGDVKERVNEILG